MELGKSVQKNKGFTLIELMVTIAVLAIIAMIAVPSFGQTLANSKLKRVAIELKSNLENARSQALLSRSPTVVCVNKNNSNTAVTEATCGGNLSHYTTMSASLKKSNIFIVEKSDDITIDSVIKDDVFLFDARGKTTVKSIKLCGGNRSYTIKAYIPGTIKIEDGSAC